MGKHRGTLTIIVHNELMLHYARVCRASRHLHSLLLAGIESLHNNVSSNFDKKELYLQAYKSQLRQEIELDDNSKRCTSVHFVQEQRQANDDFFQKTVFRDEGHFPHSGLVNGKSCRIWAAENSRSINEIPCICWSWLFDGCSLLTKWLGNISSESIPGALLQ